MDCKKAIIIFLLVIISASPALAYSNRQKISFNPGGLLAGVATLDYEERITSNSSYVIEMAYWEYESALYGNKSVYDVANLGIGMGNRFYPGRRALQGLYLDTAFIMSWMNGNLSRYTEVNGLGVSAGVSLGVQLITASNFTIDLGGGIVIPVYSIIGNEHISENRFGGEIKPTLKLGIGYTW